MQKTLSGEEVILNTEVTLHLAYTALCSLADAAQWELHLWAPCLPCRAAVSLRSDHTPINLLRVLAPSV